MTYANPFLRLVVIGTLYDVEDFSFSLNFIDGPAANPPSEVFPGVVDEVSRYFANSNAPLSLHASLTTVKLNLIGENGRYVGDETVLHDFVPPIPGGSSSNVAPQLSLCISTTTDAARGRAHAGRYYLPIPGGPVQGDGRLSPAYRNAALAEAKTFITNLNQALYPWRAGVVSNVGAGEERPITGVRVGLVMDTMRSRRDKFTEDYAYSEVPDPVAP